jgi:DNA-binding MarR family transcriptional regulator
LSLAARRVFPKTSRDIRLPISRAMAGTTAPSRSAASASTRRIAREHEQQAEATAGSGLTDGEQREYPPYRGAARHPRGSAMQNVRSLTRIRRHIIYRHMKKMLEQKHLALLEEAERRAVAPTDNIRACFELLTLARAIDRDCAARLAPHRLSEGKFVLLFLLHGKPDGLSPHELSERAGVTRATITGLLDGLERDGFIARRGGLDDRRKIAVALTDAGRKTARDLFIEHAEWVASLFEGFTADERKTLNDLLLRIWRNLDSPRQRPGQGEDARA